MNKAHRKYKTDQDSSNPQELFNLVKNSDSERPEYH